MPVAGRVTQCFFRDSIASVLPLVRDGQLPRCVTSLRRRRNGHLAGATSDELGFSGF